MRVRRLAAVALLLAFSAEVAQAAPPIMGQVARVIDGDTFVLQSDKDKSIVLLEGIDAPEGGQPFSAEAKAALSALAYDKLVYVFVTGKDRYNRTLGTVIVDGRNINRELVAAGLAWHYEQKYSSIDLAAAERNARESKSGLWANESPMQPWIFRAIQGNEHEAAAEVFITRSGNKYHCDGCRYLAKSRTSVSIHDARMKYEPCTVCKPGR